ncbi:MAG: hypothetical protein KJZ93_27600 [Caldilineaceae bacterium]|nr:hypothetical protein [Caldilineaceae bacterium]
MRRGIELSRPLALTPVMAGAEKSAPRALGWGHLVFATQGDDADDEVVRVQRRRQAQSPESGERQRAATPQRRRDDAPPPPRPPSGGGQPPPSSGGGGMPPARPLGGGAGGGGLPLPGGMGGLIIIGILLLFFFLGGPNLFSPDGPAQEPVGPQVSEGASPTLAPPTVVPAAAAPTPTRAAGAASGMAGAVQSGAVDGQTWTVMLYMNADDQVLEYDIFLDLNEAERIGSTDRVQIVAQIDRFQGGFRGDGDWTSTRRYFVTQDDALDRIGSELIADLGELDMSDTATLIDFAAWAIDRYPADRYVLIMSDHGLGWPGGWADPAPGSRRASNVPLASRLGGQMYTMEIDDAFAQIRSRTGVDKFEVIGMDACLMGHLEVFTALAPHARYAVASQEVEPALGWAYTSFLGALAANPDMDGATLAKLIVDSYIHDDQRIVDDQARAEFTSRGSPLGGLFGLLGGLTAPSAEQVASQLGQNITLTAVDLEALAEVNAAVNDFAFALQGVNPKSAAQARAYAQSYTSIFGSQVPASYIDLGHFVGLFKQAGATGALGEAGDRVLAGISRAVIAEKHGPQRPGSTGLSIYFPVSELYRSPLAGPQSYTAIAGRFAQESLWDDYLTFHYTGQPFEAAPDAVAAPPAPAAVRGPGAGAISLSPITASADVAAPGQPVLLSTQIEGENVGYVYLFAGYYDQAANAIFVADMDYLESSDTRELSGVYYPVWPERDSFTLEFEWEPLVFAVSDGVNSEVALFTPQSYGVTREAATYTVDGVYTYASGESRSARLYFRNSVLHQVLGYTHDAGQGAPREIIPQRGDQFTIAERWMDLDQSGRVAANSTQSGGVLTFGEETFTVQELDAAAGEYIVGLIVEDLDGNQTPVYTRITVE